MLETGLRRLSKHNPEARSYLRSTTKAIVTLYGFVLVLVLAVALSLVMVDSGWAGLVYMSRTV